MGALLAIRSGWRGGTLLAWALASLGVAALFCLCWLLRQLWVNGVLLRDAESLWVRGANPGEVIERLSGIHLAGGELGYHAGLLRSMANLAKGYRDLAWRHSMEAHTARQRFWIRPLIRIYFRFFSNHAGPRMIRLGIALQRMSQGMPRLGHALGTLLLDQGGPVRDTEAWRMLLDALPHLSEDPILLEDLMLCLLDRLQNLPQKNPKLGRQITEPELRAAFERVLGLLLHRHGDPRLAWDRGAPAFQLLRERRFEEVLALAHSLPPRLRPEDLWEAGALALHEMGDSLGAWQVLEDSLVYHPASGSLWLRRFRLAMERRDYPMAKEALNRARNILDAGENPHVAMNMHWHRCQAEYALWVEEDANGAWAQLGMIPELLDEDHSRLLLEARLALGQYEAVYRDTVEKLKEHPDDSELLLIQADCLSGMGKWEALNALLGEKISRLQDQADFWHLRGLCRSHLGDLIGSRDDLERGAHMDPSSLRYVLDAGHACAELGEWERSEYHWRQALRLDERSEEALTQLAEARRTLHDTKTAKHLLRECLIHHPNSQAAQVMLAELEAN